MTLLSANQNAYIFRANDNTFYIVSNGVLINIILTFFTYYLNLKSLISNSISYNKI